MVLLLDLWCSLRYDTDCHPFSAVVAARGYVYLQMPHNGEFVSSHPSSMIASFMTLFLTCTLFAI